LHERVGETAWLALDIVLKITCNQLEEKHPESDPKSCVVFTEESREFLAKLSILFVPHCYSGNLAVFGSFLSCFGSSVVM